MIAIVVLFLLACLWLWVRDARKRKDAAGDGYVKRNWPKDDEDKR